MDIDKDVMDDSEVESDDRIREVILGVIATHSGRPVDEVDTEMRFQFEVAGVTPHEPSFNNIVQRIAVGDHSDAGFARPQGPA